MPLEPDAREEDAARSDGAPGHEAVERERLHRGQSQPSRGRAVDGDRSPRSCGRPRRPIVCALEPGRAREPGARAGRRGGGERGRDRRRRRPAATRMPVSPSATTSGTALTRVATTGSPASIASSSTIPNPSQREVWTKMFARSSQSRIASRPGGARRRRRARARATRARVSCLERPAAENREHRVGVLGVGAGEGAQQRRRGPSARSGARSRARAGRPARSRARPASARSAPPGARRARSASSAASRAGGRRVRGSRVRRPRSR